MFYVLLGMRYDGMCQMFLRTEDTDDASALKFYLLYSSTGFDHIVNSLGSLPSSRHTLNFSPMKRKDQKILDQRKQRLNVRTWFYECVEYQFSLCCQHLKRLHCPKI